MFQAEDELYDIDEVNFFRVDSEQTFRLDSQQTQIHEELSS